MVSLRRVIERVSLVIMVVLVSGCDTPSKQPAPPPMPVVNAPVQAMTKTKLLVDQLLGRADSALAMQHLSSPAGANAYDLYKAVLRVEPSNPRALEGLSKVAEAYVRLIEECIRGRQLEAATRHWQSAKVVFPADARILALGAEITKLRVVIPALTNAASTLPGGNSIVLPQSELKAKAKSVEVQLQTIAKRVQHTDEAVLIFARNDAEGRWIYKVMREAVGDYRIRGDIKIAATPSIQLQLPIR